MVWGFGGGGDENILIVTVVMVVQLSEYTKNHWIVSFKGVTLCHENYISIKNFKAVMSGVRGE